MNLVARLLAAGAAADTALLHRNDTIPFDRLRRAVGRVAQTLLDAGLQPSERVVLLSDNSPFAVAVYLGAMAAGATVVPLSPLTRTEHLVYQIEATESRFGFVQCRYRERFGETDIGTFLKRIWTDEQGGETPLFAGWSVLSFAQPSPRCPGEFACRGGDDDIASIMFTSGSTGTPRGVMVTHRNLLANTASIVESLDLGARDRALLVLPLCYCYGASVLHTHLCVGGSVAISNNFMFPEKIVSEISDFECTAFYGVPSSYQILLRRTSLPRRALPKMRFWAQAGGKLPTPFVEELRAAHPRVSFFLMYGQTEATARLSCLPPDRLADKLGSIGRGIPGTVLRVLRADGSPVTPGEVGEIVAEGANITAGYWRDPEETAAHFKDGRLYTGDLATVDEEGFIFVADRARDFIKVGGVRVGSKEVEEVLAEIEDVVEAAVIGAPDEVLGEAVIALLVRTPESKLDIEQVLRHCRRRLANDKVPKKVIFVGDLPKNEAGKVLKARIREQYATAGAAGGAA